MWTEALGELNENRNLMWTKRGKARLILIFSTNTNCENMGREPPQLRRRRRGNNIKEQLEQLYIYYL